MDGVTIHYLDGTEVTEPMGWADFTEELVRDRDRRFISVKYEGALTFTNDGYSILDAVFRESGHCGIVAYEARQECGGIARVVAKGSIIVADIRFNLTKCEAECSIADDGIGARIINNLGIPVSPNADQSKNGKAITAVPTTDILLFDPDDPFADYLSGSRKGWDWYACFLHAVLYVTDDTATAVSDWYDDLPFTDRYLVTNGYSVRSAGITVVRTSYTLGDLFFEMAKKYNLWIGVERSTTGAPILRLEPEEYWYSATVWGGHQDIQDLVRTADPGRLYAKVDVGCDKAIKETETTLSLPYIPLNGFVSESFHLEGVCNTDAALDLVSKWVIDSNVIEDVAVNGNKDYDSDLFLIQYRTDTLRATKGDYLQPGNNPWLYNFELLNSQVIERYALSSSVGAYFDPTDASFKASRTRPPVENPNLNYNGGIAAIVESQTPTQFNNDYEGGNFDDSNAWGNGTAQGSPVSQANSRYTAAASGYYEFEVFARFRTILQNVSRLGPLTFAYPVRLRLTLERYDSGNNLVSTQSADSDFAVNVLQEREITHTFGTSLNATDYVIVVNAFVIESQAWFPDIPDPTFAGDYGLGVTFQRLPNWYIRTNFIASGGYVAAGGQGRIIRYEFDRITDTSSWVSLTADPKQKIMISGGPQPDIPTHIIGAKRNVMSGKTEWAVIQDITP